MLNGVDPIIIFNFRKIITTQASGTPPFIPIVAQNVKMIDLPVVPIYLSEKISGVFIQSENKNIDIDTTLDTLSDGSAPVLNQRAITSTVKIEMVASRDSIGMGLFAAMADLILPLVTSKEYSITYLHGAVTVFNGVLHSFAITQNNENDLYNITLEIVKPSTIKLPLTVIAPLAGAIPI